MEILQITLNNLASFEGIQVIDFTKEPLRSAGLYSIVGETGSGKSTILDAICLAFYGTAPRFYQAGGYEFIDREVKDDNPEQMKTQSDLRNKNKNLQPDDPRNMLHWGSKECWVVVDFIASDHQHYRASWFTEKKRTNYSDCLNTLQVQHSDGTFKEIASVKNLHLSRSGNKQQDIDRMIQVYGLRYEEFTRSVMLAQNSFANFIKANDREKALTLEKITGTQLYTRVAAKIQEHYKLANDLLRDFNLKQEYVVQTLLSEEELQLVKEQKEQNADSLKRALDSLQYVDKQQKWLDEQKSLNDLVTLHLHQMADAEQALQALSGEFEKLRLYDELQAITPEYANLKLIESQRAKLEQEDLPKAVLLVAEAKETLSGLDQKYKETVACLEKAQKESEESREPLKKVRSLLTQIEIENENLSKADKAFQTALKQEESILKKKSDNEKALSEATESYHQALLYLKSQERRKDIFEHLDSVLSKLDDFQKAAVTLAQNRKEKALYTAEVKELVEKSIVIQHELTGINGQMERVKNDIDQLGTYQGPSAQALSNLITDSTERKSRYTEAGNHMSNVNQNLQDKAEAEKGVAQLLVQEEELKKNLHETQRQKDELTEQLPGMERAYTLFLSKNYVLVREQLQDGQPCPVCGSVHHPFKQPGTVETASSELRSELDRLKEQINQRSEEIQLQQSLLGTIQKELGQLGGKVENLNAQLIFWKEQWALDGMFDLSFAQDLEQMAESDFEKLRQYANEKADEFQKNAAQAREKLRDLENWQTQKSKYDSQLKTLTEKQAETKDTLVQSHGEQQTKRALIQRLERDIERGERECELLHKELERYPFDENWLAGWEKDAENFKTALSEKALAYKAQVDKRSESEHALRTAEVLQNSLDEQAKQAIIERTEYQKALNSQKALVADLIRQRVAFFRGEMPDQVEEQLNRELDKASVAKDEANKVYNQGSLRLSEVVTSKNHLESRLNLLLTQIEQSNTRIVRWLADNQPQLSLADLKELLDTDTDWQGIRRLKSEGEEKLTQLKTLLKADEESRMKLAESEFATTKSPDELAGEQMKYREAYDLLQKQGEELSVKLSAHARAEKELADRRVELDRLTETRNRWSDLKDIIGNTNGDALRNVVQTYTLAQLINLANVQLRRLRSRYRLVQVPDTLSLKVIDSDFGDAERSLSGLSGGETFIVSLALALGLSTLSSNNLNFSMLFIDEGFGTLSKDYLNTVIDSLSALQEIAGKKVCVISHTSEMRERVPIQIEVIKSGNEGSSRLQVSPKVD